MDGVSHMPGVYKIVMVRMSENGLTNPRMYESRCISDRNVGEHASAVGVVE